MKKINYKLLIIPLIVILSIVIIPLTHSKYLTTFGRTINLDVRNPKYDIVFNHYLPEEYQEVEYIRSNGNQYINTGIRPSNTLSTEIIYADTSATGSNYVLGSRTNDYNSVIHYGLVGSSSDLSIAAYYNTANNNEQKFSLPRIQDDIYYGSLEIQYKEELGYRMHSYLEDMTAGTSDEKYSPYFIDGIEDDLPYIYVFAIKPGHNHKGMDLYSLKMYDDNVLIGNFIPCYRKSDNVIGLYDMVTNTFHTNSGSGNFTIGPLVTDLQYHEAKTQHFEYNVAQNLNANSETRNGLAFDGWNTSPDGIGYSYEDEEEVLNLSDTDEDVINLYARWRPITYSVKFYSNYPGAPSGYTKIGYIESDGTQYINTGYIPNQDTRMIVDFEYNSGYRLLGSERRSNSTASASSSNAFRFGKSTSGKWYVSYGNQGTRAVGTATNNRHTLDFNKNNIYLDNEILYSYNYETFTAWGNAFIFNINNNYFTINDSPARAKLYSMKIYDNEVLVRDYIPVYRNSDGEVGLYDLVNNVFVGKTGTNNFLDDALIQEFTYNQSDNLDANTYEAYGYKFVNWNTEPDGSGTSYEDEEEVLNLANVDGDVVSLFAQWEVESFNVTINAGYGVSTIEGTNWTNSGTNSISIEADYGSVLDLNNLTVNFITGYTSPEYIVTGILTGGNLADNVLTVPGEDIELVVRAKTLETPNISISGGTDLVYGKDNINLSCNVANTYNNNTALYYSFGYPEDKIIIQNFESLELYDEINVANDSFYVIDIDRANEEVTLITKYPITNTGKQSDTEDFVTNFANTNYWATGIGTTYPGSYSGNPKPYIYDANSLIYNYVELYANNLASKIGINVTGRLLSLEEANTIPNSIRLLQHSNNTFYTYWLGTSTSDHSPSVVSTTGGIGTNFYQSNARIRPVVKFKLIKRAEFNDEPTIWTAYNTTSTYSVPIEYKGNRYYSCRAYATDEILTSQVSTNDLNASATSGYVNARINFDPNSGVLQGTDHLYVEYNTNDFFEKRNQVMTGYELPLGDKEDYDFNGWWTSPTGGLQVIDKDLNINPLVPNWTNLTGKFILENASDTNSTNVLYAQYTESVKTLYNVLKKASKNNIYAKEYTGNHQDSMDNSKSTEKIYHWYADNSTNASTILNKNNVVFADKCWQMIRTTDTGGVRLIYNGEPVVNGSGDNITYDCGTSRAGHIGGIKTIQNLSGNYYYGDGYTTTVSGTTTTYTLTNMTQVSVNSTNSSTIIPTIVSNYPYTCRSTNSSGSCTTLYKVDSYSTGTNANVYASTPYRDSIGIGTFNSSSNSVGDVGYMYNKKYTSTNRALTASKTMLNTVALNDSYLTTYGNYYFSDSYEMSGNNHVLLNAVKGNTITDYPTSWVGKYMCQSNSSSTCATAYYISGIDTSGDSPILYMASIASGKTETDYSYKYLIGDTIIDNEDGTFEIDGNVREILSKDWYSTYSTIINKYVCMPSYYSYDSVSDKYICSDNGSINVGALRYITNATATNFTASNIYKYGFGITDDGDNYKLVGKNNEQGTLQYIYNWPSNSTSNCFINEGDTVSNCGYKSLLKSHYTCFNLTGVCSTYNYINYTTASYAYYVQINNGKYVSTDLTDTNNILYEMLMVNNNNSTIKNNIETWYQNTLLADYDDYIDDTIYCNNRKVIDFGGWNPDGGITSTANYQLSFENRTQISSNDLSCQNITDRFSYSNNLAKLKYKVGLMSVPEFNIIGITSVRANAYDFYLASPSTFNTNNSQVNRVSTNGSWITGNTNSSYSIRPSISLVAGMKYNRGDGSTNNPYVVDLDSLNG